MPPHLHPRSRSTSILFTGTLLASFIVVGLPHIYPCPAPRRRLADSAEKVPLGQDGQPVQIRQRRRRTLSKEQQKREELAGDLQTRQHLESVTPENPDPSQTSLQDATGVKDRTSLATQRKMLLAAQEEAMELEKRECPVPKPTGFIGYLIGFRKEEVSSKTDEKKGLR